MCIRDRANIMEIVSIIKVALLALLLACGLIGTFGETFNGKNGADTHIFLYKQVIQGTTTYYSETPLSCDAQNDTVAAALAFGIIGCICTVAAIALSVVGIMTASEIPSLPGPIEIVRLATIVVSFIGFLIAFALGATAVSKKYCSSTTSYSDFVKYSYGMAFLIISWIVAIVCAVLEIFPTAKLIAAAPAV
eukprot:TRINITY_DN55194_c0_g1_i2.p1 TRINITY_DN55194_c0_g1~~TRINITY_DN55194_c0_g1_i2.p1  ORF type:complete len:192 (-),score=82.83 TRINITY_DN55194_c0_g1_i2:147-722(-)